MKIQIGGLSEGIHRYEFKVAPRELELGEQFPSDVAVQTTLDKTPNQILLTSQIHVTASVVCDRCVASFTKELNPSYSMFYMFEGSEYEHMDPAEFQVVPTGQHVIDIADDVRQSVLLAVPLKLLCKESCKGLCPSCGQNLNEGSCSCREELTDSRWDQLRKLQSN
jgi:uncharacterized protein